MTLNNTHRKNSRCIAGITRAAVSAGLMIFLLSGRTALIQAQASPIQAQESQKMVTAAALKQTLPLRQPLFESHDIIDMTLTYDINTFRKDKGDDRAYHKALLSYKDENGTLHRFNVEIKARGKLRRTFLNCLVPPYKLKLDPKQIAGTLFEGQQSIKLVTHCKTRPSGFEDFYIQEYLVYRTFNLLTPLSFKVRMVHFTYIDSAQHNKPFTQTAFFLENYNRLCERAGAENPKTKSIELTKTDPVAATLVSVFQYMIGNTDWSIRSGHNVQWVTFKDKPGYFPVPYDFDLSGIIDASYARPDERFPIRSVRERYFRGHTRDLALFYKIFAQFRAHKEEIIQLYRHFPLISDKIRNKSINYIEEFYHIIKEPKLIKRYFIDNFRGRPRPKL